MEFMPERALLVDRTREQLFPPEDLLPADTLMSDRTRLGLSVLVIAFALGVLGDALLRATPWGINILLWITGLVAAITVLIRWQNVAVTGAARTLLVLVAFFAGTFAWRDSVPLKLLDALAILVALSLFGVARSAGIRIANITQYLMGMLRAGWNAGFGLLFLLASDIQWKEIPRRQRSGHTLAILRGLLLALPLLLLFGGLFTAADAVFEEITNQILRALRLDVAKLFSHVFLTLICGWIAGGYLRGMLMGNDGEWQVPATIKPPSIGVIEAGTVLGLIDLLFLGFVVVQVRYFFGGAELVRVTPGLSYAEYARRGFFELVLVAALVLPLLLLGHWLLRKDNPLHERIFRALAWVLLFLLMVIMASAVQRMRIYQREYGLTQLRLYTTVFMGWLAIVIAWFAATVLRGRRQNFIFGALIAGFLAIAFLHALNPDAFIIRTNAARTTDGRPFDVRYATSLSADAIPTLVAVLPDLSEPDRRTAADQIRKRWSNPNGHGWRTWSWGRREAIRAAAGL